VIRHGLIPSHRNVDQLLCKIGIFSPGGKTLGSGEATSSQFMQTGSPFQISIHDVHVWIISIKTSDRVVSHFERILSEDEVDRASRFRFPHLRDAFVISHGCLRHLLGQYLDLHPATICFSYGHKGKPSLSPESALQFNLTHSNGMAAVALTSGCQIGVDLEHIRPMNDMQQLAGQYFCPEEIDEIMSLPSKDRERAFFLCWTRKEAYIKAIGDGLSCPLDSFRVTVLPDIDARLIHIGGSRVAAEMWTLHDLGLAADYAATVAYRDRQRSLSIFPIAASELLDI
jgi:4'-phosphopantetheinyl transferase